ncbi:MAG TPA: hypothetical protein VEK73_03910 [Xanthobacteraceae bacterium]|nr:hypothetical protein [Xanthobacteraceae bacterium]
MKRSLVLGCILCLLACSSAIAGDPNAVPPPWPSWWRGLPLDPTWRAQSNSVRLSDACWRTCENHCSHRYHACTTAYAVNDCRAETDACDLDCIKACRTYGGPFLGITDSGP